MPKFEVFIPHSMAGMPDMTLHIDADNWMFALQIGRKKLGEQGDLGSNIMCDFKDDGSVHVTDPATGRVFRILEIQVSAPPQPVAVPPAPVPAPAPVAPAPPPPAPAPAPAPVAAAPAPVPVAAAPAPRPLAKPVPMDEKRAPKEAPKPVAAPIADVAAQVKVVAAPAAAPSAPIGRAQEKAGNIEDVLADIFSEVMDLWSTCKTKEDVANFMLDLALKKISAESGGVFFSDIAGGDLMFLAARGPKAKEVMKFKVPMGVGIVGFCAGLGVSVAISDVNKDPRWYNLVSKSTGYDTKSIICSVIQYDGQSLGALELVNKKGNATFTVDELNILNYIAHEAGDALARVLDQEFVAKSKK